MLCCVCCVAARALETVGWELGPERCSVELSVADGALSGAEVELLEALANAEIRQHSAVHADEYRDRSALPAEMRSRGDVPSDGALRVVTIEGVDAATCCGTHVRNTAELQCVKLLGTEHGRTHTTRVVFVAGGRVLRALGACLEREHALGASFACAPERFAERVEALFTTNSALKRDVQRLEAAVAARDVAAVAASAAQEAPVWAAGLEGMERVRVVAWHSSGASMSVLQQVAEQLAAAHGHALPADTLLVLTATAGSAQAGPGCYLVTLLNGTTRDCLLRIGVGCCAGSGDACVRVYRCEARWRGGRPRAGGQGRRQGAHGAGQGRADGARAAAAGSPHTGTALTPQFNLYCLCGGGVRGVQCC